jgi:hypothetical protein
VRTLFLVAFVLSTGATASAAPALIPRPNALVARTCVHALALTVPLTFGQDVDPGGFALLRERWTALGVPAPERIAAGRASVALVVHGGGEADEAYRLAVDGTRVRIVASSQHAAFDALATLAQLPERDARGGGWHLACQTIDDAPAMRWRIVSDDVSRGPFPTMAYAKARIRALAALKIDGWSPYMEQVIVDPRYPYVAWPNGWTPTQLHALAVYAHRFHVALIPEQQTFAHLHESLKWETLAPLAELPHGYLIAESDPRTYEYLAPLLRSVIAATVPVPFVHVGADEPIDLGHGRTPRTPQVFADHVTRVARIVSQVGARPMIWDDAVQQDPTILRLLPRDLVIVSFHYGAEPSYRRYLDTIANAGFAQMVAPGAANWNEIYPDLDTARANIGRFVGEAKTTRGMLGMFMTVWHDDGESLYEATWPALAYAAASAWQTAPVDERTWNATFTRAFFGSDDARYATDLDTLAAIRGLLRAGPDIPPEALFWRDPFDPALQTAAQKIDLAGVRTRAEHVLTDLWDAHPPLHTDALAAMRLGALRYVQLGRRLQIGAELPQYYEDARTRASQPGASGAERSLNVAKYLCWEMRDALTAIAPAYAAAWRAESTEPGLERVLVKYRLAEANAQRCADAIDAVERDDLVAGKPLPPWSQVWASAR